VQGRTLLLKRGGRTRQMDDGRGARTGALLDAMRATLTGDAGVAAKHFRTELSGTTRSGCCCLVPLDERLARQVRQIELVGQAADVRSIALQLAGGDRSLMLPLEPHAGSQPAR
jgi:hypothetical protein